MEKARSTQFKKLVEEFDQRNVTYKVIENPSPELVDKIKKIMTRKLSMLANGKQPSMN